MSSYEVRAIKFIHQVFDFLQECHTAVDYYDAIYVFNKAFNRKVQCGNGQTRIALITSDYVVKFDYNARGVRRWGGCEAEYSFYQDALRDGYEYLFAKIKPYYYRGQVFYIMPRVHGIGRRPYNADEYMTADEANYCYDNGVCDLHNFNYGWKDGHVVLIDYAANEYR